MVSTDLKSAHSAGSAHRPWPYPLAPALPMKPLPSTRTTADSAKAEEFDQLKRRIHNKLVDKLDLSRVGDLQGDVLRREIRLVVEHLCDTEEPFPHRTEPERLVEEVLDEPFGFGPLEMLLKDNTISDIL